MSAPAPTIASLQAALDEAERDLICADMGINGNKRREAEMARINAKIADLKRQIAIMGGSAVPA